MFVRCKRRFKDGKEHRYWSVVENVRVRGGRVVQRQVLYLGEINDSQRAAWCRSIEVVEGTSGSRLRPTPFQLMRPHLRPRHAYHLVPQNLGPPRAALFLPAVTPLRTLSARYS